MTSPIVIGRRRRVLEFPADNWVLGVQANGDNIARLHEGKPRTRGRLWELEQARSERELRMPADCVSSVSVEHHSASG